MLQISRMRQVPRIWQVIHQRLAWKVDAADVSDSADVSFDTSLRFWQLVWDASRNKGKRPD